MVGIADGCARMFRNCGAELAVTYLNDKAKQYVAPLAETMPSSPRRRYHGVIAHGHVVVLDCICRNQDGQTVISGEPTASRACRRARSRVAVEPTNEDWIAASHAQRVIRGGLAMDTASTGAGA